MKIILRILYVLLFIISTFYTIIVMFSGIAFLYGIIKWIIKGGDLSEYVFEFCFFLSDKVELLK